MSTNKTSEQPLIEVRNLKQYFNINAGFFKSIPLKAVDDISFTIRAGFLCTYLNCLSVMNRMQMHSPTAAIASTIFCPIQFIGFRINGIALP